MGFHMKSILAKNEDYIEAYLLQDKRVKLQPSEVRVCYKPEEYDSYILKTNEDFLEFSKELPKYFTQAMNLCQMMKYC